MDRLRHARGHNVHRDRGKRKGPNKANQSRGLHSVMTECPRLSSYNPWMVCLLPWKPPCSDLISPINSIRYPSKYKHCSLHPSSSGQNALLIYSLLLCWLVFPVVPRIPPFRLVLHSRCDHLVCWKFCVCLCVHEALCECLWHSLWWMPDTWDWLIWLK